MQLLHETRILLASGLSTLSLKNAKKNPHTLVSRFRLLCSGPDKLLLYVISTLNY